MTAPRSAAEPRPNNRPYYIDPNCPICGTALVLLDTLDGIGDLPIWYDEWICPNHVLEGVHMDWPAEKIEELRSMEVDRGKVYTNVEDLIRDLLER
jgi:hypothetical protein